MHAVVVDGDVFELPIKAYPLCHYFCRVWNPDVMSFSGKLDDGERLAVIQANANRGTSHLLYNL